MALPLVMISTLLLIFLVTAAETGNSLQNNPFIFRCFTDCSRYGCKKIKDVRENCPGGIVYGVCGCCLQCAKREGEDCGGYKNLKGTCDEDLYCHVKKKRMSKYAVGKCKKVQKINGLHEPVLLTIGNQIAYCQPDCTPEFCSKHPEAVCSAVMNAKLQRTCQFPCQHTTCQACYFEPKDEPPCRKCSKDDFECLRKFGKCVRKDSCTRAKYPCMTKARRQVDGKFRCKVPACEI